MSEEVANHSKDRSRRCISQEVDPKEWTVVGKWLRQNNLVKSSGDGCNIFRVVEPWLDSFLKLRNFLFWKMIKNRKSPTESETRTWLEQGKLTLPPLRFGLRRADRRTPRSRSWDFEVEALWGEERVVFAMEYKTLFTPKAFHDALAQCRMAKLPKDRLPLVMLPYLRPSHLEELERSGISGVDWCGNGVIVVPDRWRVFRSGGRNQFSTWSPIKNIYRKNTSMVARVFLALPRFASVRDILAAVHRRDLLAEVTGRTRVTMGTISKALKLLEADLIVDRGEDIRLLQVDKLLDQLHENYEPMRTKPIRLKVDCAFDRLPELIGATFDERALVAATGLSSVSRYASMQQDDVIRLYCVDARHVQSDLKGRETERFPNLELIETSERPLYFDARREAGFNWASPVQTWLELMHGDKRDQETAQQVRDSIVRSTQGSP